jgi:hypothetical protein
MQDELFQGMAALRDHQQPMCRAACDERFLDGPASGDELLVRA